MECRACTRIMKRCPGIGADTAGAGLELRETCTHRAGRCIDGRPGIRVPQLGTRAGSCPPAQQRYRQAGPHCPGRLPEDRSRVRVPDRAGGSPLDLPGAEGIVPVDRIPAHPDPPARTCGMGARTGRTAWRKTGPAFGFCSGPPLAPVPLPKPAPLRGPEMSR